MNEQKNVLLERFFSVYEEDLIKILQNKNLTPEEQQKEIELFGFVKMAVSFLNKSDRKTIYKLFGSIGIERDNSHPLGFEKYKENFQEALDKLIEEKEGEKFLEKYRTITGRKEAKKIEGYSLFALILNSCLNLINRRKDKEITKTDFIVYFSKIFQKSNILYNQVNSLFLLAKESESNKKTKKQLRTLEKARANFLNLEKELQEIDNIESPLFTQAAQFSLQILSIFADSTQLINILQPDNVTKEKKNLAGTLEFADEFLKVLTENDITSPLNALKLPMVCKPVPYDAEGKGGGYLFQQHNKELTSLTKFLGVQEGLENLINKTLQDFSNNKYTEAVEIVHKLFLPLVVQTHPRFIKPADYAETSIDNTTFNKIFIETANHLSAVPFKIDKEELDFLNKIAESQDIICEDLVTEKELELSKQDTEKALQNYKNFQTNGDLTNPSYGFNLRRLFNIYLSMVDNHRARKQRKAIESLYLRYLHVFSFAENLYFPVTMDARTRIYLEPFFSVQLGKAIRACFNFGKTSKVEITSSKEESFAEYLLEKHNEGTLEEGLKSLLNIGYHAFGLDKVIDKNKGHFLYYHRIIPLQTLLKKGESAEKELFEEVFKESKEPFLCYKFLRVFTYLENSFTEEKNKEKKKLYLSFHYQA